jgi:hypothetical protein
MCTCLCESENVHRLDTKKPRPLHRLSKVTKVVELTVATITPSSISHAQSPLEPTDATTCAYRRTEAAGPSPSPISRVDV